MSGVVADTHAVLWYVFGDQRLSAAALAAMTAGGPILVPSISLVEITYLIEKGRIPAQALPRLIAELSDPAAALTPAPLDLAVAETISRIPRHVVPDLPDRVIAATALVYQLPLISRDRQIQAANLNTIW